MFAVEAIKKKVGERQLKASTKTFSRTLQSQRVEVQRGLKECSERKIRLAHEKARLENIARQIPSQRNTADEMLYIERQKDNDRQFKRLTKEWGELDRLNADTRETLRTKDKLALVRAHSQIKMAVGKTTLRDKDLAEAENEQDEAEEVDNALDEVRTMVAERAATPDRQLREDEEEQEEKEKKSETIFDDLATHALDAALHGVPLMAPTLLLSPAQQEIKRHEETRRELLALIQQLSVSGTTPSKGGMKKPKKKTEVERKTP